MKDPTSELLAAMVAATPDQKAQALKVLRGDAAMANSSAPSSASRKPLEPFVGLRDVAEFLGVSARSVRRWGVPLHKLGRRSRFKLSEVETFVRSAEFQARTVELRALRSQPVT